MKTSHVRIAALAALLVTASAVSAFAADGAAPSLLALPALPELGTVTVASAPAPPAPELALLHVGLPETGFVGVHYRPRSGGWGRHVDAQTVTQVHIGFFDPEGSASRQFLLGVRGGPMVSPNVQLGLGVDWSHIADNTSTVSHQSTGPNGTTITVKQDLARASTNLFPLMAYVQVQANDDMGVIPYFGVGAGYEFMNLSADNYQTNASFDATYGGWGWQLWGGAGIPLSGQARVNGEVFVNTAELSRDVTDEVYGGTYRETVKSNGVGMRLGVAWGF